MSELTADRLEEAIIQMSQEETEDYLSFSFGEFIVEVWSLEPANEFELNIQAPLSITGLTREMNQLGECSAAEELLDILSETLVELDVVDSTTTQGFYLVDTIEELAIDNYNYYTTHSLSYSHSE